MITPRRRGYYILAGVIFVLFVLQIQGRSPYPTRITSPKPKKAARLRNDQAALGGKPSSSGQDSWTQLKTKYPVEEYIKIPTGRPASLPRVQFDFQDETEDATKIRLRRRKVVKKVFRRAWSAYRRRAWLRDEVSPISGEGTDWFGGWAATLIDSLDTLWIMGMKEEFEEGVDAVTGIDFAPGTSTQDVVNVFETNIRHLGGLIGAYDLSGDKRLLEKAVELADMLYIAFDTPNRMPITRWRPMHAASGSPQGADEMVLAAEMGSFCLEFTRLTQLTGDPKYFDAAHRITKSLAKAQPKTRLPGLFNLVFNPKRMQFDAGGTFKLGAMIDSLYEYLPKTYALLGGMSSMYRDMYDASAQTAMKHIMFKPYTPDNADILVAGEITVDERGRFNPQLHGEHLGCFTGGMYALGGRLTGNPQHVDVGRKLTWGCVWAYKHSPLGIMPETFAMAPCPKSSGCAWNEEKYREAVRRENELWVDDEQLAIEMDRMGLRAGFTRIPDKRYILRPEAIESVFVLYRITGDEKLLEAAWDMFTAIEKHTKTSLGNAGLLDVLVEKNPPREDRMESFWLSETLKYFYLIFSEPSLISLDEFVLNTEAHPFRLPRARD